MPCCALAAVLVGQMLVALGALRATLLGRGTERQGANPAVEWRLSPAQSAVGLPARSPSRWTTRRSAVAFAVAFELVLVLGAAWGIVTHFREDAAADGRGGTLHEHGRSWLHDHGGP